MTIIKDGDLVLFQGDSSTDCGRNESPDGLGNGYAAIVTGLLASSEKFPRVRSLNRGVSGDRSAELLARWKTDCEDLKPNVLSIKVGVNDVWRLLGEWCGQTYIGPEEFRANYRKLLDRALDAGVRQIILCSPTMIDEGKNKKILDLLIGSRDIVKELSAEYHAVYVPTQECQIELLKNRPDIRWTIDGCHPTSVGHAALARCWLEAVGIAP
jgi:lysophospholipase L1-like esterase